MKKKAYRAVDVKKLNVEKLLSKAGDERVIFGIDVAKEDFYCSLMNNKREVLTTVKWKHPFETEKFVSIIKQFPRAESVLEPSGTYGDPLRYILEKFEIPVYRVSPKRSHDAAEVYDGVPSWHDAKSAAIISKLHLDGASEKWKLKQTHERDLVATITTLDILSQQFIQNTNRLEALMAKHWPELNKYFKFNQVTFLELASCIGGPFQVSSKKEEAYTLMKKIGGPFLSETKIKHVINSSSKTIGVPMTKGELVEFKYHTARTLEIKREINKAKKKVERLSQENESTKNIGKTVGKATAAVIVTFCGDPRSYKSCNHWLKSFGLNLKEKSSGKHKGRLMITRRGSGRSRRWLYLSVLRLIQKDPIIKAWYAKKIERDGGMKMKGIVAIMRKLVRALWYVARGDEFDSRKMFDARNLNLCILNS